ncbi:MAG: DUF362 domain-containing protein [Deltaproteobacteria bacterium]|nr:DUF362 domain-containing protein [Deltaproteobacteria bacterium]
MAQDRSRRELLKLTVAAGAGAALTGPLGRMAGAQDAPPAAASPETAAPPVPVETVALVEGDPVLAVRRAVALVGGMEQHVKKGQTVVVKPNIGFPTPPDVGGAVSPAVVAEVARLCVDAGASRVIVIDHPCRRPEVCLKMTGIEEACRTVPKTYVFATTDGKQFEDVAMPKGVALKKTAVLKDLRKAGTVVNLATAKSHGAAGVSFCLKNLMGAILAREPFHKEFDLHQAIADLATAIPCQLNIVDASRAMVTGGPAGPGEMAYPKSIVAGTNIVAVDAVAVTLAKWYGKTFAPRDIKHIALAERHGLGPADLGNIRVLREKV